MFNQFSEALNNLTAKLGGWVNEIILALPNLVLAAIVLILSIYGARKLKRLTNKTLYNFIKNSTVVGFISNLMVGGFMIIALFVILNILNLSDAITALLGTAGVLGLAFGLAVQDPLINLFSGVLMSVRDHYKVGDLIKTNGYFGEILQITLRATVILQPDGQEVIIPNKDVLQTPLKNYSNNGCRRIEVNCGVSYADDLESVKTLAIHAIKSSGIQVMESKPIEFYFTEFANSSINFKLFFWKKMKKDSDYHEAKDAAIIALKKTFDNNKITIPFPITTLDFGISGGKGLDEICLNTKINNLKTNPNNSIIAN